MTKEKELKLTIKQEAFARAYVETGNASEAYRRAYSAEKMKPGSVSVNASKMLSNTKVALRLQALKEQHAARHVVTVDDIIRELEEARVIASNGERPQASAMVAASMGKAKILGFIVEKSDHTSSDGSMSPAASQEAVLAVLSRKYQG